MSASACPQHPDRPPALPADPTPTPVPWQATSMAAWRHTIVQGNLQFERGAMEEAGRSYFRALHLVQSLWRDSLEPEVAMSALMVTHHNLGAWYLERDEPEHSADHLCEAHELLWQLSMDTRTAGRRLRGAALTLLPQAKAALVDFVGRFGHAPYASAAVMQVCGWPPLHLRHLPHRPADCT